jgi:hypothetical protein
MILLVAAAAAACAVTPAYAATDAECQAMWTKADVNKDGMLSDAEGMRYAAAMRVHDENAALDGRLDQTAFLQACKTDVYAPRPADAGAPLKGANSFTEGQAKDRALSHGLTDVGYELLYDFPQPTPLIMVLGTHFSRASDIIVPDRLTTTCLA